jgi:surface carbohydrate biosynthesis protein
LKRILFILNKPNRELAIMNAIRREIADLAPDAETKVVPYDARFMDEVLAFRPDVMMTFPMTSVGLAEPYYVFKHLFGTQVYCFRAEGIIDPGSPQSVSNHVGYDEYGPTLVDGEIFWGPGPAKLIGDALLAANKLSSPDRVNCFGYPRLERYFGAAPIEGSAILSEPVRARLEAYGRKRTILLATGFHFANYTREMIFAAKDLDAENRCDELLGIIEEVKRFRASWIEGVLRAARESPDLLFVLKKHPIERREDYSALEEFKNVLYVWQDVDIGDLIERAAAFFHYGSTSLADAYLARVPAVYVHSREPRCHQWFPDMGWPSARSVTSEQIPEVVGEFRAGRIVHDEGDPGIKAVLDYNFNIRDGEAYQPSRRIAQYLLQDHQPQRVPVFDAHRWRALSRYYYFKLRRTVGRPIKKALRSAMARLQQ